MYNSQTRHVARIIVIDLRRSVLLVRYDHWDADKSPYWVPPGGALESGESERDAANRELKEETGLGVVVGRELWKKEFTYRPFGNLVVQMEQYFLVKLDTMTPPVINASHEDIKEHRWWPLADLTATHITLYPDKLVTELKRLPEFSSQ